MQDRPSKLRPKLGNKVTINGGNLCDLINTFGDNVSVSSGKEQNRINNCGNKVTIDAVADDDSIFIRTSLYDNNGNLIKNNVGNNVSVNGGAGNDTIINNCRLDLTPYDDNDGSNVVFKYASGDGNDIIYGFRADSTISIGG